MSNELQFRPRHIIAQANSKTSFFEILDVNPPFLKAFELPNPKDYKDNKFVIQITDFSNSSGNGKATHIRNYIDYKELVLLMDQMSRFVKGDEILNSDGSSSNPKVYSPIFQSYKGSPDTYTHPEWETVSRITKVTYGTYNSTYGYYVELSHQEGKKNDIGAIMPSGNKEGQLKAAFRLALNGQAPSGLYIPRVVSTYLAARESTKQELWRESYKALVKEAKAGTQKYIDRLAELDESYGKHVNTSAPENNIEED
jgi:hypothetical protein